MIILRSAINRGRWERAIGCRFDPAFMDILLVYLEILDPTFVILSRTKSSAVFHNKK